MRIWASILLCGAASCGLEVSSDFPPAAIPFATPQLYLAWWQIVEECSGKRRPLDAVRWYQVRPGELTIRGESAAGAWFVSGNRIVLSSWVLREGGLVRHEMLHAILETGSHPAEYFERKCGAEVACSGGCGERPVLPDGNVFVSTGEFGESQCSIGVMIESTDDPRWAKWECGWLEPANDGRIYFAPGETRRLVFDFDVRLRTAIGSFRTGRITVSSVIADNVRKSLQTTVLP
jgi:hypothetical protein